MNTRLLIAALLLAGEIFFGGDAASALPVSNCVLDAGGTTETCSFFPSDASGNYSAVSSPATSLTGVWPSGIWLLVAYQGEFFNPAVGGAQIPTASGLVDILYLPEAGTLGTYCGLAQCPYADEAILYTPDQNGVFTNLPFAPPVWPEFNSTGLSIRGIRLRGQNDLAGTYIPNGDPIISSMSGVNFITPDGLVAQFGSDTFVIETPNPNGNTNIPEPATLILFAAGLAGLSFIRRFSKPRNAA